MSIQFKGYELSLNDVIEAKPCESGDCDRQAAVMVWCDHHVKGCDYTGFRCEIHFNLLLLDTVRQMKSIADDWLSLCASCGQVVEAGILSDHLRWARL